MGLIDKLFIGLNKVRLKGIKKKRINPGDLLLLFSHCLQNSECPNKIVNDLANCKRCGKCVVKDILELRERSGIKVAVSSGGEMALEKVKLIQPKAIVAIACDKELRLGIKGVFPRPVCAIPNKRPKGPCKDCMVEFSEVEKAVQSLIILPT